MVPYKKGSRFYIKMYGTEYELILPKEEIEKEIKNRKTTPKVVSKTPTKVKGE